MDKTLGQIAYESCTGSDLFVKWVQCGDETKDYWESIAAAVAAAVKEEDALICDAERAEFMAKASENNGRESDFAFGSVNSAERIAAAIRASIKEVK